MGGACVRSVAAAASEARRTRWSSPERAAGGGHASAASMGVAAQEVGRSPSGQPVPSSPSEPSVPLLRLMIGVPEALTVEV